MYTTHIKVTSVLKYANDAEPQNKIKKDFDYIDTNYHKFDR